MESRRHFPNVIITGTPGSGKSTISGLLLKRLPESNFHYYNISKFAQSKACYDGYDEGRKSHIVDEDKLLDLLEPLLRQGGSIIDWHVNDIFPERLVDLVVVLRCDNSILFHRLANRGYHQSKIDENIDAEIMGVVLQDASDSYEPEIVVELTSNNMEQMENNVDRIVSWIKLWRDQHSSGVTNELLLEQGEDDNDDDE